MSTVEITFPGGTKKAFDKPVTGLQLLPFLPKTSRPVVAIQVNNELFSLTRSIDVRVHVEPVTNETTEGSNVCRRTLCLVLASAARQLYPELRLLVGHSLGYGYYYTLESSGENIVIDLDRLEQRMREIIEADMPITSR